VFWSGAQRTGGQAIALAVFIVLSRLLEPSAFGLIALANGYLLVVSLLIEQGVNQAVVQRKEMSTEHLDAAFLSSVVVGLLLAGLTLVLAGPIAGLFGEPTLEPLLRWLSLSLVLTGLLATQMAILQRDLRFRALAVRTAAAETVGGVVAVSMALAGLGVWSLVGQALGRGIAGTIVLWGVSSWRPRLKLQGAPLRDLTRFGTPVVADRLVAVVQGKADDMLIGLVLGTTALGYYSVGYRLLTYLTQLVTGTVQSVALPVLSRLQADLERLRRVFLIMLEYLALGAFPVFVGIAFVAPELVPLVFGPRWSASIPVMQVLALAGAAKVVPIATSTVFLASGKPWVQLRLNTVTTSLAVVGFALFVSRGIVAVALVHLLVNLLVAPLHAVVLRRSLGVSARSFAAALYVPTAGVLLMGGVLFIMDALRPDSVMPMAWLVLEVALGAAAYVGGTFILGRSLFTRARGALAEGLLTSPGDRRVEEPLEAL
jgi:PST family polysaccharide transporter